MADERDAPTTQAASIDDGATGRWQTTEAGSTYVVGLDQRVITRVPELRDLRRVHEAFSCTASLRHAGCSLLQVRPDDLPTLRLTSHIIRISRLRPAVTQRRECGAG